MDGGDAVADAFDAQVRERVANALGPAPFSGMRGEMQTGLAGAVEGPGEIARAADVFIAGFTGEKRPPRGIIGKVDWYLGGFISRQIIDGRLNGEAGSMTLVAVQGKLLTPRLLLVGLGDVGSLDRERAAESFLGLGEAVRSLGLRSVAMEIPPMETPRSGSYRILGETLRGFREAFTEEGTPLHCEIQILARTEDESEGWRRVVRGLLR